jgi:hypothetical protein
VILGKSWAGMAMLITAQSRLRLPPGYRQDRGDRLQKKRCQDAVMIAMVTG